jgi:hypothetical protein
LSAQVQTRTEQHMQIVRAPRPESNFSSYSNAVLRDTNLSMKALGLLVRLLSHKDGWRTDYRSLAQQYRKDGETSFRSAFKELREEGYLAQTRTRGSDGRWSTTTTIYDEPQGRDADPQVDACGDFPRGATHAGEPPLIRSTKTNNLEEASELHSPAAAASGPEEDPPIPERDADDDGPTFVDWRPEDFQRFAEVIGSTHIHSDGTGPWNEGDWPVAEWYGAFRKRRGKPMNWPGQYFDKLEADRAVEDYLAALGLEPVDPDYSPPVTDPWATSKSA